MSEKAVIKSGKQQKEYRMKFIDSRTFGFYLISQ